MELPEITVLAGQMNSQLSGLTVKGIHVENEKCLNMPLLEFKGSLTGSTIQSVTPLGKWVDMKLKGGDHLLFNSGMGCDVTRYEPGGTLPEKYHIDMHLEDSSGFTVRVWWFCYLHLVDDPASHKLTSGIGPTPLDDDFTLEKFRGMLSGRRGGVKTYLTNQRNIAGIGNVYIQDILFMAGLHPLRKVNTLTEDSVEALYNSMRLHLKESIAHGGLSYEKDFYGNHGGFGKKHFLVAYKTGEPCPRCGTIIEKIKTGSTSSYVCPACQPL